MDSKKEQVDNSEAEEISVHLRRAINPTQSGQSINQSNDQWIDSWFYSSTLVILHMKTDQLKGTGFEPTVFITKSHKRDVGGITISNCERDDVGSSAADKEADSLLAGASDSGWFLQDPDALFSLLRSNSSFQRSRNICSSRSRSKSFEPNFPSSTCSTFIFQKKFMSPGNEKEWEFWYAWKFFKYNQI